MMDHSPSPDFAAVLARLRQDRESLPWHERCRVTQHLGAHLGREELDAAAESLLLFLADDPREWKEITLHGAAREAAGG